ncbi:MAG: hypothetical protein ACR2PS_12075, partial [Pseudomonadales bacterium]
SMEKVMYPVWKPESQTTEAFREVLIGTLADKMNELGASGYRVCVHDDFAARSTSAKLENTKPHPDGMLSLWMDSANDFYRAPFDQAIESVTAGFHGYLVAESEPVPNTRYPVAKPGERTHGMCQVVMLRVPDRISYEEWLDIWRNSHSFVGIGTQSTFGYRQNSVVQPVTYAALEYDAFIEESFPEESMFSQEHYYDEQGEKTEQWDPLIDRYFPEAKTIRANNQHAARWQINALIMQESVKRFIDIGQDPHQTMKIDCMPYSEYVVK